MIHPSNQLTIDTYFCGKKSGECVVNPATDDDHGQDVGHVSFDHVCHHIGISHGILHLGFPLVHFEISLLLVVEEEFPPEVGLDRERRTVRVFRTITEAVYYSNLSTIKTRLLLAQ